MKKRMVLHVRIFRYLKSNAGRYGALFLLLVIGLTVIIGIAAATDSIVYTVEKFNEKNRLEDGSFSVLAPLTAEEMAELERSGVLLEENFSLDFELNNGSVLRIFKNRKEINLVEIDLGRVAIEGEEIVLEKLYAIHFGHQLSSTIVVGGMEFTVSGTGSAPDYNCLKKNLSDVGTDIAAFSIAFVPEVAYEKLKNSTSMSASEEYNYSFRLQGATQLGTFKETLKKLKVNVEDILNPYVQDMVEKTEQNKNELLSSVDELADGAGKIQDGVEEFVRGTEDLRNGASELKKGTEDVLNGVDELSDGMEELTDSDSELLLGAEKVFDALIKQANQELTDSGLNIRVSKDDYSEQLRLALNDGIVSGAARWRIENIATQLDQYNEFYGGLKEYTSGVDTVSEANDKLSTGADVLAHGSTRHANSLHLLDGNSDQLVEGAGAVFDAILRNAEQTLADAGLFSPPLTRENYAGVLGGLIEYLTDMGVPTDAVATLKAGLDEVNVFYTGVQEYTMGVQEAATGATTIAEGAVEWEESYSSLASGIEKIADKSDDLRTGADTVFTSLLESTNEELKKKGLDTILTAENYSEQLNMLLVEGTAGKQAEESVEGLIQSLDDYVLFRDGLNNYVNGVNEAYDGVKSLRIGASELQDGLVELYDGASELVDKGSDLSDGSLEVKDGSNRLRDELYKLTDDLFVFEMNNLISFMEAGQNPRLIEYKEDAEINKNAAIAVGIVFLILIAYIISVFVVDNLERESAVIGTLYAMGYKENELLRHFLLLPVVVITIGSLIGTLLGFTAMGLLTLESTSIFSYPSLELIKPAYLVVYGILVPFVLAVTVNLHEIHKKLSVAPLRLLRKERRELKISQVDLGSMGYVNRFRIRQLLKEIRSHLTLFFGLYMAIFLMIFGFTIYGSIVNMNQHILDDVKYQYMYLLKYPEKDAELPGSRCYTRGLQTYYQLAGRYIEVTVQGISQGDPFFGFSIHGTRNELLISSSARQKFGWKTGDKVILSDPIEDMDYAFTVKGVVSYSNGLYVFMDIEAMRELFGEEEGYYNTVLSEESVSELEVGRILSITTKDDIRKKADVFMDMMRDTIIMILVISIILFVIILYLLLKIVIDRAAFGVSLVKMFGYNNKEVRKIYLGGNKYTVILSMLLGIPLGKALVNFIYPALVSNVSMGFDYALSPQIYMIICLIILGTYFVVDFFLRLYLNRIHFSEVLKNMD